MIVDPKMVERLLAKNCMGLTEMARRAHISSTTLSKVMKGYDVRPVVVGKIAQALGVCPEQIIVGD